MYIIQMFWIDILESEGFICLEIAKGNQIFLKFNDNEIQLDIFFFYIIEINCEIKFYVFIICFSQFFFYSRMF